MNSKYRSSHGGALSGLRPGTADYNFNVIYDDVTRLAAERPTQRADLIRSGFLPRDGQCITLSVSFSNEHVLAGVQGSPSESRSDRRPAAV